jgi:hypothetical protein
VAQKLHFAATRGRYRGKADIENASARPAAATATPSLIGNDYAHHSYAPAGRSRTTDGQWSRIGDRGRMRISGNAEQLVLQVENASLGEVL